MMVVEEPADHHKKVVGLLTSRDLLRIMASGLKDGETSEEIMNRVAGDFMTPISQVIYGRPDETVGMCRTIMAKLGIKALPILSREGRVEGLITARDMSDFGLSATDKGGKKSYLNDVSERVGLSSDTSMAEPPTYLQAHLALEQSPLYVNMGAFELPHPFKSPEGCGMSQRGKLIGPLDYWCWLWIGPKLTLDYRSFLDHGPREPTRDADLSEDALFVYDGMFPDEKDFNNLRRATYFGVADGVGSWREYDVDPRNFSHKLMQECENILGEVALKTNDGKKFRRMISPSEILAQAYERVKAENIIGSCTACIALFDNIRHQLHFSNLGDSGIIVLRHIDSDVAGSLKRDRATPRHERVSDLRVSYVSQQQLRSFNHPYQLGWTGEEVKEGETSFKSAKESCSTSIHLRRGDIVIMATDGLFDNVDIDDIAKVALEWEQKNGFIFGGDIAARERRWKMGDSLTLLSAERIPSLAEALCEKAREASLDPTLDSPFAILAKENDIMWSGGKSRKTSGGTPLARCQRMPLNLTPCISFVYPGMPDDCTVIVAHVVGQSAEDTMNKGGL